MRHNRLLLLVLAAILAACSGAGTVAPGFTSAPGVSSVTPTPSTTTGPAETAPPVIVTEPTETPQAALAPLKIVQSGYSTFKGKYDSGRQLAYGVVIENPNQGQIATADLSIAFIDADGSVLDTVDQSFAAILPGQRVAWADTMSDYSADWSKVKSMEVNLSEPTWEAFDGTPGNYSFSKIKMTRDIIKDIGVTARLKSTFTKELENPQIVVVFYKGSKIIGGGWTYLEHARDGAAVKLGTSHYPKVDKAEMYGALSSLSLLP